MMEASVVAPPVDAKKATVFVEVLAAGSVQLLFAQTTRVVVALYAVVVAIKTLPLLSIRIFSLEGLPLWLV